MKGSLKIIIASVLIASLHTMKLTSSGFYLNHLERHQHYHQHNMLLNRQHTFIDKRRSVEQASLHRVRRGVRRRSPGIQGTKSIGNVQAN